MSEPLVKIQSLSKRFDTPGGFLKKRRSMLAVRDVSLSIARGDIVGVVGESGCGKSSLARLVLRLIEPTEGAVCFEGADLTQLSRAELRKMRQRMAMVFQDPYSSLDPRYRVADALAEPFVVQGQRVPRGRIDALMEKVGLPPSMTQSYPHQLSGGQRQRVGIARALALNPDFIVLDEPTASLDVSIQAQIVSLIQDLQRDLDLTYLFISHDLGLVRYFCNRIVVMYLGAVVEELPDPGAAPRHPYTRALMASTFAPDPNTRQEATELTGEIPSGFDLPRGCAFAARCPNVTARCRETVPVLSREPHPVACFHPIQG